MRLMLNNKPVFQVGPLDQGCWPDGLLTAADRRGAEVRPRGHQEARLQHGPQARQGRAGPLVLPLRQARPARLAGHAERRSSSRTQFVRPDAKEDATFTDEDKKQFRTELKAMIDHLRFFPCIVVWVPFNEGWGQHDTERHPEVGEGVRPDAAGERPERLDRSRVGDMNDMHIYPGPGMFPVMPDRVSVLGEFGGLGLPLEGPPVAGQGQLGLPHLQDDRGTARRLPHCSCAGCTR